MFWLGLAIGVPLGAAGLLAVCTVIARLVGAD